MPLFNAYAFATKLPDAKFVLYGDAAQAFLYRHAGDFAGEVLEFTQ
ncbi:MAG: hypothetical protein JWO14_2925 [Solirubrobacterales bacterium]|nr:hypothetical protein [Solirubrobacterales bacterium]